MKRQFYRLKEDVMRFFQKKGVHRTPLSYYAAWTSSLSSLGTDQSIAA